MLYHPPAVTSDAQKNEHAAWRRVLAPHMQPRLGLALLDVATSVAPYLALIAVMFYVSTIWYPAVLLLAIPAAGFLLRTFIVFHDCAHGSFVRSKRANAIVARRRQLGCPRLHAVTRGGGTKHAIHHATTGDLDRRGIGDIQTP